jgi:hypothetical protein
MALAGIPTGSAAPIPVPPGPSSLRTPTPPATPLLRTVTPEQVKSAQTVAELTDTDEQKKQVEDNLAGWVRRRWGEFRNHRYYIDLNARMLQSFRAYNAVYDDNKLRDIRAFGGSELFSRISSLKCRAVSALLRDIFTGKERPWEFIPTPEPVLPEAATGTVDEMVLQETVNAMRAGLDVPVEQIKSRLDDLDERVMRGEKLKARREAFQATSRVDDLLVEGGFYEALVDFLVDLPVFPYAVLKGPIVRSITANKWVDGKMQRVKVEQLQWQRVSPFDIYFTPGVSKIQHAEVCERIKLTRADLQSVRTLPGYNTEAVDRVLEEYALGGLHDWLDELDTQIANLERREDPHLNRSHLIDAVEYHGNVPGRLLRMFGMTESQIPNEADEYAAVVWVIGREVIKAQLNPDVWLRHPYYVSSFEKVPGAIIGNGLIDLIRDIQDVCNASLRALVNNASIASGPQVVVNTDRMSPGADYTSLYPWKRWFVVTDALGNSGAPINFFQPNSNVQELLGMYERFSYIADEISSVPRYITSGSGATGGAAGTASGLAMLMNNASKALQAVAANIDMDVLQPALRALYDHVMLLNLDAGLRGDERIRVRGVTLMLQKETERQRKLEFLGMTMNPADMTIIGTDGRAAVLRNIAEDLGMTGDEIVPDATELKARQEKAAQMQNAALQQEALRKGMPGGNQIPMPGGSVPANPVVDVSHPPQV